MKICTVAGCDTGSGYYAKDMCRNCYHKDHRKRRPEIYQDYERTKREKHGDKIRAYDRMRGKAPERRQRVREYYRANIEDRHAYDRERWKTEHRKKWAQEWKEKNVERVRSHGRARYRRHKDKHIARVMERRAHKGKATPKWLTPEQKHEMFLMYKNRPDGHHVDHIVPLQGKNVCGLHVPWNLQHLPVTENLKKGNRFGGN